MNSSEGWKGHSHNATPATSEPSTIRSITASNAAPRGDDRSWSLDVSPSTPSMIVLAWMSSPPSSPRPHARAQPAATPRIPATTEMESGDNRNGARAIEIRVEIDRLR